MSPLLTEMPAAALAAICRAPLARAERWLAPIVAACNEYSIDTPPRLAAFLANVAIESAWLSTTVENLNYKSAARLRSIWPSRFKSEFDAQIYAGKPELLANFVYADRLGNGPPSSGDGWKFRGRGLKQVTGRTNYAQAGIALGLDLIQYPELLEQDDLAARSAGWYWSSRACNQMADAHDWRACRRAVNGPAALGLTETEQMIGKALQIFERGV